MKTNLTIRSLFILMVLAVIAGACNKEEDPPEVAQELSFKGEEVLALLPEGLKNSNDQYAQECYSMIEAAVDMSSFIDNMDVPEDASSNLAKSTGNTWNWTYHWGGYSFTFYWSYEERNSKRYWAMDVQFGNGPRYDYIDAWETMDGMHGGLLYNFAWIGVNDENFNEDDYIFWRYTWDQNSNGGYTLSWVYDATEVEYDAYMRYDVLINPNGSGAIDYYMMDALFYQMIWDALGNGSWGYYVDGEAFMEGLWTI